MDKISKEIADFVKKHESEYCYMAIRGDDKDVVVGEILDNSKDYLDGDTYGEELAGTSAYMVTAETVEKNLADFFELYRYANISVVTGNKYSYGDDANEVIIPFCKVLATWSK